MKIIDLSADFRLKNPKDYELWYKFTHPNQELLQNAVYGLCELYKEEIKSKFSGKSRLLYHLFYLKSLSAF